MKPNPVFQQAQKDRALAKIRRRRKVKIVAAAAMTQRPTPPPSPALPWKPKRDGDTDTPDSRGRVAAKGIMKKTPKATFTRSRYATRFPPRRSTKKKTKVETLEQQARRKLMAEFARMKSQFLLNET